MATDEIADLETRLRRRRVRLDEADARVVAGLPEGQEQAGEQHHRQDEIGGRPGRDDRRALQHRLRRAAFGARPPAATSATAVSVWPLAALASPRNFT